MDNIAKTVTRLALAVFGVRSVYSAIRGAMSTLSQYDEQMATNIEYIRFVLASALKPIIETIIFSTEVYRSLFQTPSLSPFPALPGRYL